MKKQSKSKGKKPVKSKTKGVNKQKKVKNIQDIEKKEEEIIVKLPQNDYRLQLDGEEYRVNMHKMYRVGKMDALKDRIKSLFNLFVDKEKRRNLGIFKISNFSYFPTFQFQLVGEKPENQKCSICQFEYETLSEKQIEDQLVTDNENDIVMLPCSHLMHYGCMKMLIGEKDWLKCPVCSTIYGMMVGDQPEGKMTWNVSDHDHCDGFPQDGVITIQYSMHGGKRGTISYPPTHRTAYLPDNKEGNQVLNLLHESFKRKLIFTIGRSVTTGRDNQIVWNGIHHKTNLSGGSSHFGYPDPTYFDRVKLEMAAKGVYPPTNQ